MDFFRGFVPSCESLAYSYLSAAWQIPSIPKIPSSASRRLCGRIWFGGDGAFAPEAWVRSASRPYPFFSIRVDS